MNLNLHLKSCLCTGTFLALLILMSLSACGPLGKGGAIRDPRDPRYSKIPMNTPPDGIEAIKQGSVVSQDSEQIGEASSKIDFAELQILTETTSPLNCEAITPGDFFESVDFEGYLSEFGEVILRSDKASKSLINVEFRAIGLDEGAFRTSFVDGKPKTKVPYNLKLSFLPNKSIRLRYLDQSVDLQLDKTPIYSVSILEQRAGCEITHNLNVFAKVSGSFNRPQ